MSAADPGEVFMHNIAALPICQPESTENDDVPDIEDFEDDAIQFATAGINGVLEGDISDHRGTQAGAEKKKKGQNKDDENSAKLQDLRPSKASDDLSTGDVGMSTISIPGVPPPQITRATTSSAITASPTSIPKGRSIAHYDMARKGTVYVSFDSKTGGEYCGNIQSSAEY